MDDDRGEAEGLRDRLARQGEDTLGKIAQDLLENPLVSGALTRAFEARERAVQAQEVAMGALNLPSAADLERLTRRLRSVSQRLEGIEDGVDRLDQRFESLTQSASRAGVDDRDMVAALGINVQLVFAGAFLIGALLAGFGGVLGGSMIALAPGEDTSFLLNSLIVVIIGGMGSLGGAAIGALALGLVDAYADVYLVIGDTDLTNYSILVTFALLVGVLAVRPLGLFGRPA